MNLRSVPGATYGIGQNFSNQPMPVGSPFAVSWWYRDSFQLPAGVKGKKLWLNFDAINYIGEDSVVRAFEIPDITGMTRTYFLRLTLEDPAGKLVSSNFLLALHATGCPQLVRRQRPLHAHPDVRRPYRPPATSARQGEAGIPIGAEGCRSGGQRDRRKRKLRPGFHGASHGPQLRLRHQPGDLGG